MTIVGLTLVLRRQLKIGDDLVIATFPLFCRSNTGTFITRKHYIHEQLKQCRWKFDDKLLLVTYFHNILIKI